MDDKTMAVDYLVSGFVTLVGAFLLILALLNTPILTPEAPGKYYLSGVAVVLAAAGFFFLITVKKGNLENAEAKTELDIKLEAIEKMKDPQLLARIIEDAPLPEVKEAAVKRLEEIA